jgi:hypothetical protein
MLITPYWFGQRQCQAMSAGDNFFRITGPNLPERFLGIRLAGNGKFEAYLRRQQDGSDLAVTGPDFDTTYNAWEAAFELYRAKVIL